MSDSEITATQAPLPTHTKQKRKIVFLASAIPDYSIEMVKSLCVAAAEDVTTEITYIGPKVIEKDFNDYISNDVHRVFLDWPRIRSPKNLVLAYRIWNHIRRLKPDLVYLPGDSMAWISLIFWLLPNCTVIATVHDVETHPGDVYTKKVPPLFDTLLRQRANGLIVHSEDLRTKAGAKYKRSIDDIGVIPHVALQQYTHLAEKNDFGRNDENFNVLFFGRILQYKGLDILIEAAELASNEIPNLKITIAGSGPDLDRCTALINKPHLFNIREGFIEKESAAQLFINTDVVALPYVEASQSGVTAIAACFGVPILATDVGDFREVVLDEPTGPIGLVVPPGIATTFSEALVALHQNADQRRQFSQNAHASARGPRSPNAVGHLLQGIFDTMLAKKMDAK